MGGGTTRSAPSPGTFPGGALVNTWDDPERYASHQAPLRWVCSRRTTGPVVELGVGYYSTPLLAGLCDGWRELWSIESDAAWLERFAHDSDWHHFVHDENLAIPAEAGRPAVVFVDHDAKRTTRADSVHAAKALGAKIILVHDTELHVGPNENPVFDGLPAALEGFKYRRDWDDIEPFTTALSDFVKL